MLMKVQSNKNQDIMNSELNKKKDSKKPKPIEPPFFIVGCARSGTTLLRNILRLHPNLNAPEETFFYRWGDPFATDGYKHVYFNNPTIKQHRSIDGVEDQRFRQMFSKSISRRDLSARYGNEFLKQTAKGKRWFDKTPQNIYGILLIRAQFPSSKIVHIYRNPLNVVASLKAGKVMPAQQLMAAINYWVEAIQIINTFKELPNNNLVELKYEALLASPEQEIKALLIALNENTDEFDFGQLGKNANTEHASIIIEAEVDKYKEILSQDEISSVLEHCGPYMNRYGYGEYLDKHQLTRK